jgi:predicted HicB family RNase H-like nuclease
MTILQDVSEKKINRRGCPVDKTREKRFEVRFPDQSQRLLVIEASKRAGLTMNGWMVKTALEAARRELGIK